jgi:SAM-dependent methyltransferase
MRLYDKENRRLVYIEEAATPDFWDSHWDIADYKQAVERGRNDPLCLGALRKYIPDREGLILEGGCGLGHIVYTMHVHGYKCIGIDSAERTIRRIKETFPELDVMIGDVRSLPFPDNYFRGYWSGGVIEHFWDGYYEILAEMRRVLVKGGYVFVSFPYMSFLRRQKVILGLYRGFNKDSVEKEHFYQFAFHAKKVVSDFEAAGFKLLASSPQSGLKGLKDEINLLKPLLRKYYDYTGRNMLISGSKLLLDKILAILAGHTVFLVFQNK